MKQISLTQGKYALVDDEDFEWINRWKWCYSITSDLREYAKRGATGHNTIFLMHRMILSARSSEIVDHRSGNGLDNRRDNLRFCTRSENAWNMAKMRDNTSGFKGVSWDKSRNKWFCKIAVGCQQIPLGRFDDAEDAAHVYNQAATQLHGEFARLNLLDVCQTLPAS